MKPVIHEASTYPQRYPPVGPKKWANPPLPPAKTGMPSPPREGKAILILATSPEGTQNNKRLEKSRYRSIEYEYKLTAVSAAIREARTIHLSFQLALRPPAYCQQFEIRLTNNFVMSMVGVRG
jgi:hypothetical protein